MSSIVKSSPAVSPCTIHCGGFSALRAECIADACLANKLCQLTGDETASTSTSATTNCADWCCESHAFTSILMVLMFCVGTFCLLLGCYYAFLERQEETRLKTDAMNEAMDAVSGGSSSLLTTARARLSAFEAAKKAGSLVSEIGAAIPP